MTSCRYIVEHILDFFSGTLIPFLMVYSYIKAGCFCMAMNLPLSISWFSFSSDLFYALLLCVLICIFIIFTIT